MQAGKRLEVRSTQARLGTSYVPSHLPPKLVESGFTMGRSEQSYLRVPRRLVSDRSMRSSDVRVFAVLMDLCTSTNEIDDGLDVIAAQTGLTKRTVCEVLTRLEERGFISRDSRRGPYTGLITLNSLSEQSIA